jgi:tetratricopeptide (TPR) repeat protein
VAFEVRGRALASLGKSQDALSAFDTAIALEPSYALAHARRGQMLRELQRKDEAVEAFERAIRLNPYKGWPVEELTTTYRELNQAEKALPMLALVAPRNPLAARSGEAMVFCDIAEYDKALTALESAIAIQPSTMLYALKGWALEYSSRTPEALAAYRAGFKLDEHDVWNRRGIGDTLRRLGQQQAAEVEYRAVIAGEAPNASTPLDLALVGWCHYGCREYEEAVTFYSEALNLAPDFVAGQFDLALITAASGRYGHAKREYKRGFDMTPSIGAPCRRGLLYVASLDLEHVAAEDPKLASAPEVDAVLTTFRELFQKASGEITSR